MIRTGVSISINPFESMYFRTSCAILCRSSRFFLIHVLLRSRYLYFILKSSPPSVSSSIVKGGRTDGFITSNSFTSISISPVGIFLFLLLRSATIPLILMTNSRPSFLALSHNSLFISILNTSCVMPYLSRRSMKVIPPRSRDP